VRFISLPDAKGKRAAQQALTHIVASMDAGAFVEPSKTTVSIFLQRWMDHIKTQISPGSFERYDEYRHIIISTLGSIPLTKLKPEHLSGLYAEALASGRRDGKGGLSPRTVREVHTMFKQALMQACVWRVLSSTPPHW
jgi:hypothetical protein